MHEIVIVFLCNRQYLSRFLKTYHQLRKNGQYTGDVILIVGNDLKNYKYDNIKVVYFEDLKFSDQFYQINDTIKSNGSHLSKRFQWHKLNIFRQLVTNKWIFYLDCGIKIHQNIEPMIKMIHTLSHDKFHLHSDAYPTYEWRLFDQFDQTNRVFQTLQNDYNLDVDYPQTTIMVFRSELVDDQLYDDLIKLTEQYPISRTNDQGIIALYLTSRGLWEQIPMLDTDKTIFYYDYLQRDVGTAGVAVGAANKYIMNKF